MNPLERTTVNPPVMSEKPCIRSLRVTVASVLRLLAAGHSPQRHLAAYPYLEPADIDACLFYAAARVEDRELAPVHQPSTINYQPTLNLRLPQFRLRLQAWAGQSGTPLPSPICRATFSPILAVGLSTP